MSQPRLIAGAMSGTSADGIDVAITEIIGRGIEMSAKLIGHHAHAYPPELRQRIFAMRGADATVALRELNALGREISLQHAVAVRDALKAAGVASSDLAAIAAHGQTLFHDPPLTMQWFDPALVAHEVGCDVVSDFRRADCAAGGQGAPLVPFADYILFRHPTRNRVLLNIGGIANLTYVRAGSPIEQLIAFDTGPGNCVSDYLCRQQAPSGPGYDVDGRMARAGRPSREAVEDLLKLDFIRAKPPKSTDGPAMIAAFTALRATRNLLFPDQVATALLFTVTSIQLSMAAHLKGPVDELIVSGGGARNRTIMDHLRTGFKGEVKTTEDLGVPAEAKEALAFALLGAATLDREPANVPSVTGARQRVVLGSVTPRPGCEAEAR